MGSLISTLLDQFALPPGSRDGTVVVEAITGASPDEFDWALRAGLGSLMYQLLGEAQSLLASPIADRLLAADLT